MHILSIIVNSAKKWIFLSIKVIEYVKKKVTVTVPQGINHGCGDADPIHSSTRKSSCFITLRDSKQIL